MGKKAIVFVDANNWYHNLKKTLRPGSVDIVKISELVSKEKDLDVLEVRWYASVPNLADGEAMYYRQMSFLSRLEKKGIRVIRRKLQKLSNKEMIAKRKKFVDSWDLCDICAPIVRESFLDVADHKKKEKGIDVWIAVDMVREASLGNVDCCVLISGDADFVPAFSLIAEIGKEVLSASVPSGYSRELRVKFPNLVLGRDKLNECLTGYDK